MEAVLYLPQVAQKYAVASQAGTAERFTMTAPEAPDVPPNTIFLTALDHVTISDHVTVSDMFFVTVRGQAGIVARVPQLAQREFFLFEIASTYRRFFLAGPL